MHYRLVQKYSNLFVTYTHDLQSKPVELRFPGAKLAFEVTLHVVETRVCFTCIYINLYQSILVCSCSHIYVLLIENT